MKHKPSSSDRYGTPSIVVESFRKGRGSRLFLGSYDVEAAQDECVKRDYYNDSHCVYRHEVGSMQKMSVFMELQEQWKQ